MKEKDFQKQVITFLENEFHAYARKYVAVDILTINGTPDLLCCVNGMFVGIEVKVDNNTPSTAQTINLWQIRRAKGRAILLYYTKEWKQLLTNTILQDEIWNHNDELFYWKVKDDKLIKIDKEDKWASE